MKKFFMVTPLQPLTETFDALKLTAYEPIGNSKLQFRPTRFPILAVVNAYAEAGEEIQVIAATPQTDRSDIRIQQLNDELKQLQQEKGFICHGVEEVKVPYAGDVATQIDMFHKLLAYIQPNDILYGCLTYGDKPMPIAELMAIQYGYRVLDNVSIGCLVYGELDHSAPIPPAEEGGRETYPSRIFDITALAQLDEIVRTLAAQKVEDPKAIIDHIIAL